MARITRGAAALPVLGLLLGAAAALAMSAAPASAKTTIVAVGSPVVYRSGPVGRPSCKPTSTPTQTGKPIGNGGSSKPAPSSRTVTVTRSAPHTSASNHPTSGGSSTSASSHPSTPRTTPPSHTTPPPVTSAPPTQTPTGTPAPRTHHSSAHVVVAVAPVTSPSNLQTAPPSETVLSPATTSTPATQTQSAAVSTPVDSAPQPSSGHVVDLAGSPNGALGLSDNLLLAATVGVFALLVIIIVSVGGYRGSWRRH